MGKRYFCDYCNRSFADSANNRKNHFKGLTHQRLRKQHYDSFKDAASRLADESSKLPCKRFMSTDFVPCGIPKLGCCNSYLPWANMDENLCEGFCDYGDDCRYSHMTTTERQDLVRRVEEEKQMKHTAEQKRQEAETAEPSLDDWLSRRAKRLKQATSSDTTEAEFPAYELPPFLMGVANLPPSLLPPTAEDFKDRPPVDWG